MLITGCPMKLSAMILMTGLICLPCVSHAQQGQTWIAGLGMGEAFGVNEDRTRPLVLVGRAEAVAFNSIVPGVSPEFGISIFTLQSRTTGGPDDYRTQIIAPDLRFRFSPFTTLVWYPYLYAGAGMAIYKVLQVPSARSQLASLSSAAPFFTAGIGISHQISENIGIDVNLGPAIALSDGINPVYDGQDDGWWDGVLSIYWIF
jgi:hypothetical protein